jgi:hypothetical protein
VVKWINEEGLNRSTLQLFIDYVQKYFERKSILTFQYLQIPVECIVTAHDAIKFFGTQKVLGSILYWKMYVSIFIYYIQQCFNIFTEKSKLQVQSWKIILYKYDLKLYACLHEQTHIFYTNKKKNGTHYICKTHPNETTKKTFKLHYTSYHVNEVAHNFMLCKPIRITSIGPWKHPRRQSSLTINSIPLWKSWINSVSTVIQLWKYIDLKTPEDGDDTFSKTSVRTSATW